MSTFKGKVVVITGASSGLGRAAALEFARAGAAVVLAARRIDALEDTARLCRRAGGSTLVVGTDVTIEADVQRLAARALELSGRIDVWVNNAGVSSFGLLDATPFEPHQRVFETNVYGAMFGARAVLPAFRKQGQGVLINVGSILSKVGQPFVPSYVISKFALRGLSEALRVELANYANIHVCTLLPYAMNTQHFETSANFTGRAPYALPPATTPEAVARAMLALARRPRRERHVPSVTLLGLALHQLFPRTVERAIQRIVGRWHFGHRIERRERGNLWQPALEPARVKGERPPRISFAMLLLWLVFGADDERSVGEVR
ncbi:MAG TPA: SDR family NAD(P)-dependent oxidoreductase [Polyangiaceae bacterium]|nr:SDR family NAD(P)-dependent oxidoreductase [Polyangiaceae bacterium]